MDWLSLTERRPNYLKGRHKDDGAKLFWVMANGKTQDHKLLLGGSEWLLGKPCSLGGQHGTGTVYPERWLNHCPWRTAGPGLV